MNPSGYSDLLNTEVISSQLNLVANDPSSVPYIDADNTLQDYILTNGQFVVGSTGNNPVPATITAAGNITVVNGPGSITLDTTLYPVFHDITLNDLIATRLVATDATKKLQSATITNANGTALTFSGSTLAASMTQDLTTAGNVEFNSLRLLGMSINSILATDPGRNVVGIFLGNGQIIIGNAVFGFPVAANIGGSSSIIVTNGPGSISLDTSQPITPTSNPTFNSLTLTGASANSVLGLDGSKRTLSYNLGVGQLLIGTSLTTNPVPAMLTPVSFQTTIANSSGNIVIGTVQNIATSSSPTFYKLTLDGAGTPQIVMGGVSVPFSITLRAPIPSSNRIYTIPDVSANADFVMTEGAQTINGVKAITNGITLNTAAILDYYAVYNHITTWGGPIPVTAPLTCVFTRIGRQVTVVIPQIQGTGNSVTSSLIMTTPVPVQFCPLNDIYFWSALTINNGFNSLGHFNVRQAGGSQLFSFGQDLIPANGFGANSGVTGTIEVHSFTYSI